MSIAAPATRPYDRATVVFHWLSALLVAYQWFGAQVIGSLQRGPVRAGLWSSHYFIGAVLTVVVLGRIAWRLTRGRRLPPDPGWQGLAARSMHGLIYAMLVATLGVGLFLAWVRGSSLLFGLFPLPVYDPTAPALRRTVLGWHEMVANWLIYLVGIHAVAALAHHYLLRDGVMRRMSLRG
ncbi:cytochrome b [Acetobacteraceae bacterium H6797]|nr:cytochrome b [Acetobacteraceae bacterium H6797]